MKKIVKKISTLILSLFIGLTAMVSLTGCDETVEYDAVNKIYTITFDFTNAVKLTEQEGKSVNELDITSLRFYFTDPNITAEFDGTRTIRFISIAFE